MRVGHINLCRSCNGIGEHFVSLVEAVQRRGIEQHVLLRNTTLAKRLDPVDGVTVGPVVRSPVMAYCLMPAVDLVHSHDVVAGQAGLLLTLTRSIPYLLTHRGELAGRRNPLTASIYRRAACVICADASDAALLRHFEPAVRVSVIPDLVRPGSAAAHLRLYQNSQSTPMAGNKGIQ